MPPNTSEYYGAWETYATETVREEEAEVEQREKEAAAELWRSAAAPRSHIGYEFRKNHKTQFPDCSAVDGETVVQAAFRVAGARRAAGVEAFSDGSVWGAQAAVDAWGQGLLALERLKNLRRHRPLAETDPAAAEGGPLDPPEEEVSQLLVVIRLNIAQALLKLREFQSCVAQCDGALEMDPTNVKGLWRKANAIWGMRNPGLAREALHRLLAVDPGNAAATRLLREIDAEEAKKRAKRTGLRPQTQGAVAGGACPPAATPAAPAARALRAAPRGAADEAAAELDDSPLARTSPAAAVAAQGGGRRGAWSCCRRKRKDE